MEQRPQRPQRRSDLAPRAERGHAAGGDGATPHVAEQAAEVETGGAAAAAARQCRARCAAHRHAMRRGDDAHRQAGEDQRRIHRSMRDRLPSAFNSAGASKSSEVIAVAIEMMAQKSRKPTV